MAVKVWQRRSSLRERFEAFVKTLEGFEDIDKLLSGRNDVSSLMRADYLLHGRQIILEQKTLISDPVVKPQKYAEKVMHERGITLYGSTSTQRLFSGQQDAQQLQRNLILNIAKVIDDDVAKADKQTRDTRHILNINEAIGILVLLNEGASILAPDVIAYALTNSFQKRNEHGKYRYPQNDGVLLISEASQVPVPGFTSAFPISIFTSPQTRRAHEVVLFLEQLMIKWASFNNAPLVTHIY